MIISKGAPFRLTIFIDICQPNIRCPVKYVTGRTLFNISIDFLIKPLLISIKYIDILRVLIKKIVKRNSTNYWGM